MKAVKKIICIFLVICISAGLLSACSSKSSLIDFIYPFSGNINSFDPQVASTGDEFLIAENCFEGLIRINDDGTVQAGVAEGWQKNDNSTVYTFTLRRGAKWHIEEESNVQKLMGEDFNPDITAHDFVFALQRTADKNTDSPLFSSISNIKNAVEIHSGKMSANKLGVKALDDYTLQIELASPDASFLKVLTTAAAMPCSEEFFNATKGRYGLGLDYSLFNGQFYVSSILEASYILKNNKQYTGEYPSKVSDITLKIVGENDEIAERLESGYYDAAYISGEEYQKLKNSNITASSYANTTVAMLLNKNNLLFTEKKLREAVCLGISNIDLSGMEYLERATSLTPPSCTVAGVSADKALGNINPSQNTEKAIELWKNGLEAIGVSSASFTVIATEQYADIAKQLVQGIQGSVGKVTSYGDDRSISFSLKINILSEEEFNTALSKGEYDMAIYEFKASSSLALNFLDEIVNSGYISAPYKASKALEEAQKASTQKLASATIKCEKALLSDYSVKPLFFKSSYYAQAENVSGVQFHPGSGRVCFVNADRKD